MANTAQNAELLFTGDVQDGRPSSTSKALGIAVFILTGPLPPVLAVTGMVGNVLSYILMNQKKYSSNTTCFYMRCTAVFDSLYIFGLMFLRYLILAAPKHFTIEPVKTPFCLFYLSCIDVSNILSKWILVFMAFDRFIALTWPLKAASICTMKRARISVLLVVSVGVIRGAFSLFRKERSKYSARYCPFHFSEDIVVVLNAVNDIILFYIPMISLLTFNIGISIAVHKSNRSLSNISQTNRTTTEKSITRSILIVTTAFLVFNIPTRIHILFWQNWRGRRTPDTILLQRFSSHLAVIIQNMNYTLNSYLYCLACQKFRNEMVKIVRCHATGSAPSSGKKG
jgi:hypothetical protein